MPDILTLTMNPALDVSTRTPRVAPQHKLRCAAAQMHPGGGGINVARVLARLGCRVQALFPVGGINGQLLCQLLQAEGVASQAIPIAGDTRQSFHVHEEASGQDWRFVLPGPQLAPAEVQACLDRVAGWQPAPRYLVASGSLPPGVDAGFYGQLAALARARGIGFVLDASGEPLARALAAGGVHMVKPSQRELREFTGLPLTNRAEQLAACQALITSGQAEVVALSLGADGALLAAAEGAWYAPALAVQVASTVGAGDSFLAGLLAARARGESLPQAFRHALATSAAALLSAGTALCQPADIVRLLPSVRLQALAGGATA